MLSGCARRILFRSTIASELLPGRGRCLPQSFRGAAAGSDAAEEALHAAGTAVRLVTAEKEAAVHEAEVATTVILSLTA